MMRRGNMQEWPIDTDIKTQVERVKRAAERPEGHMDPSPILTAMTTVLLHRSSRRLERLTGWLIGLTVVLAVLTGVLVYDVVRRLLGN